MAKKHIEKPEYLPQLDVYPSYKGGNTCVHDGYVWEFCPGHHLQNNWGWVAQHRLVAESKLGRRLVQSRDPTICEAVHHRDENRLNNDPDNLEVMIRQDHIAHHGRISRAWSQARITREQVVEALEGRTLKDAARLLKVDTMTLRNRFPELLAPRKRKTPAKLDQPSLIGRVREFAASPGVSLLMASEQLGISKRSVARICDQNKIEWLQKDSGGQRRGPHSRLGRRIDDPELIDRLRRILIDPTKSLLDAEAETGLTGFQIGRIQRRHRLPLIPKGRTIEKQVPQRKKPIFRWRQESNETETAPVQQSLPLTD